jgi:hypothetical protein
MQKYKTIFSLRVRLALRNAGFEPIMESPNPYKTHLKCWVYEITDEFLSALNKILEGDVYGS